MRVTVTRLVLVLDAVDDVAEVVAYFVKRFDGHGHQCGVRGVCPPARSRVVRLGSDDVGPA
jgi:hypothetical protein